MITDQYFILSRPDCVSGQEECNLESTPRNNLFVNLFDYNNPPYSFEIININNASLPAQSVPDYPEHIERPDFVMFDSKAGVVRACGGNIPTRQSLEGTRTDKCFSFDGFEWTPMAPLGKFSINRHCEVFIPIINPFYVQLCFRVLF